MDPDPEQAIKRWEQAAAQVNPCETFATTQHPPPACTSLMTCRTSNEQATRLLLRRRASATLTTPLLSVYQGFEPAKEALDHLAASGVYTPASD